MTLRIDSILAKKLTQFHRAGDKGWAKAVCPFHKDTKPSFYVNIHSGYWTCFGCGARGWLQELFDRLGIHGVQAEQVVAKEVPERRKPNETNYLPEYILGAYRSCPTRLLKAGFKKDILKQHEVGFDTRNLRITFPIRDIDGKLAAVSGRNLNGEPRYQIYTYEEEFPDYVPRPKDHIWNLHNVAAKLSSTTEALYVAEGYKVALWLTQHGYNAVALMGAQMTKHQRNLLSRFDVPIVLCMDNDSAGRMASLVNYLELSKTLQAKVVEYPDGIKQLDELPMDKLHETLNNTQDFRRFYENVVSEQDEGYARSFDRRRKALLFVSR